jgi:uncharacterized protein (DUF433 family)
MSQLQVVTVSPDVMSGTPVFRGTRVPVQNLVAYLKAGDSRVFDRSEIIDEFLEGFPTVTREQVIAFLNQRNTQMNQEIRLALEADRDDPEYQAELALWDCVVGDGIN